MSGPARARRIRFHSCRIAELPEELRDAAVRTAIEENPANAAGGAILEAARGLVPDVGRLAELAGFSDQAKARVYALTGCLWRAGTTMPVYFLDNPDAETRRLILAWANEWNRLGGSLPYVETRNHGDAIVRVDRDPREGYYSYLGTGNKNVPRHQKTMNLASFTARTPEAEYRRVVCHEFGHQRGYGHAQSRKSVQARLLREKVIRGMMAEQGWSRQMVIAQVFPDLGEGEITADAPDEELTSVMMYPFRPSWTVDGKGIPGGDRITARDAAFDRRLYGTGGDVAKPEPETLAVGGSIDDAISAAREIDYFPVRIDTPGEYVFRSEPAMALGLYDADRTRLLAPSAYGPGVEETELTARLDPGPYVLGVKHHFARGTGPYRLALQRLP